MARFTRIKNFKQYLDFNSETLALKISFKFTNFLHKSKKSKKFSQKIEKKGKYG